MALNGRIEVGARINVPKYILAPKGMAVAEYGDPVPCIVVKLDYYMGQFRSAVLKVEASGESITLTPAIAEKLLKAPVGA